jgi:hypothetical protein
MKKLLIGLLIGLSIGVGTLVSAKSFDIPDNVLIELIA